MVFLTKPSANRLRRFLAGQADRELTYREVGATAGHPPSGYTVDTTRIRLGSGAAVFTLACEALRQWRQFGLGWVDVWQPDTPLERGHDVAVMGRSVGVWWLNACRIVYTVNEPNRYGFAYGTLPGHIARGEERFLIEWDQVSDEVWYDILAFSHPHHWAARIGYPLVRRRQKQFGQDSAAAMFRAVNSGSPVPVASQSKN